MAGKRGIANVSGMRHRRKGGLVSVGQDNFDRSHPFTLANQIDAYLRHLGERNYSPKTLEMRRTCLLTFLRWTHERELTRAQELTRPVLESYQRFLHRYRKSNGAPLSVVSQRSRLGSVQSFFSWLCRTHQLQANPAADLELPRKPARQLPKGLSLEEMKTVLAVPDTTDPLGVRDRAILETFYSTGIRRSELVNLNVADLDTSLQTLRIHEGKGGRSRVVPLGEKALYWIERYLEHTRPLLEMTDTEPALYLSGYGSRLNSDYVGNWVTRTIRKSGIGRSGSCHLFRHSCATHMLENGADIRFIQQLLGHARLDTTQIYTEVAIKALREVHARTHPSAGAATSP